MLCFDCLVADSQNVMSKTLDKRYGVMSLFFDVLRPAFLTYIASRD